MIPRLAPRRVPGGRWRRRVRRQERRRRGRLLGLGAKELRQGPEGARRQGLDRRRRSTSASSRAGSRTRSTPCSPSCGSPTPSSAPSSTSRRSTATGCSSSSTRPTRWSRTATRRSGSARRYYKQLPGDFWLFPPSYEKDQSSTEDAANELKSFLDKYPGLAVPRQGEGDPRSRSASGSPITSGTSRATTGIAASRWAPCCGCAACSSATAASATTRKRCGCSAARTSPSTCRTARSSTWQELVDQVPEERPRRRGARRAREPALTPSQSLARGTA